MIICASSPPPTVRCACSRSPSAWACWSWPAEVARVLKKLTRTSLDNKDFPWLTGKEISVGAASAHALRVNFIGELGWELHHPIEMQTYIFDKLMEAGAEFDIKPFGIRAMLAMSVEKSYR